MGIRPDNLKDAVALHNNSFEGNAQQDAHEFMLSFLNLLHDETLRTMLLFKPPSPSPSPPSPPPSPSLGTLDEVPFNSDDGDSDKEKEKENETPPEPKIDLHATTYEAAEARERRDRAAATPHESPSLVRRLLEGTLAKRYECVGCGHVSQGAAEEVFCAVSLPVSKGRTVQTLLEHVLRDENVTRDCTQKGLGCPKPEESYVKTVVRTLPHYLVLHVNRFSFGTTVRKESGGIGVDATLQLDGVLDDEVEAPADDAMSFTDEGDLRCRRPVGAGLGCAQGEAAKHIGASCLYALRAVVHHLGVTATSGHYVTDFLDEARTWQRADDSRIASTPSPVGNSTTCYIMVYERVLNDKGDLKL